MDCWDWQALLIVGLLSGPMGIVTTVGATAWLLLHRTRD